MPLQKHLKPSNTEVSKLSISQESVNFLERADLDRIIQDNRLVCLDIPLNSVRLSEKHFGPFIGIGTNLEFTCLENCYFERAGS